MAKMNSAPDIKVCWTKLEFEFLGPQNVLADFIILDNNFKKKELSGDC